METKLYDLNNKEIGSVKLNQDIFGFGHRLDLIKRTIDWQLSKRQSGCHKTKTVSEISGTTKKPFKQKGTGNARQGSLRSVQMRGGAVAHGPVFRSHATKLPKQVRKQALKSALSIRFSSGDLVIVDDIKFSTHKTSQVRDFMKNFGKNGSYFIIDNDVLDVNFQRAIQNIHNVNAVPQIGANVYDIVKHDVLIITKSALKSLEERLSC